MNTTLGNNELYNEDLIKMSNRPLSWEVLKGSKLLIAGATGLIGRNLTDLLMYMNEKKGLDCHITVLSRNEESARRIFPEAYFESPFFTYISHDICEPIIDKLQDRYDHILHLASNTHPRAYAEWPIGTILSNVYGTKNLLDYCALHPECRFLLASSVEIYGENRGDTEYFDEDYLGFINSNTLRAGYPESKRVCESLCQAYIKEKNVTAIIPRLPRIFGPTMGANDSKAVAQFIRKAVSGEDIVLKSEGTQHYSFLCVSDAVMGILTAMLNGDNGEALNIADAKCDGTLREAATICAEAGDVNITFELPDEVERQGYSTATKARLNGSKIAAKGWYPDYTLGEGLKRTIAILRQNGNSNI